MEVSGCTAEGNSNWHWYGKFQYHGTILGTPTAMEQTGKRNRHKEACPVCGNMESAKAREECQRGAALKAARSVQARSVPLPALRRGAAQSLWNEHKLTKVVHGPADIVEVPVHVLAAPEAEGAWLPGINVGGGSGGGGSGGGGSGGGGSGGGGSGGGGSGGGEFPVSVGVRVQGARVLERQERRQIGIRVPRTDTLPRPPFFISRCQRGAPQAQDACNGEVPECISVRPCSAAWWCGIRGMQAI